MVQSDSGDIVNVFLSFDDTGISPTVVSFPKNQLLRECVDIVVEKFALPINDGGGNPIQYLLGRAHEDGEDEIMEPKDKDGREMTLIDYNVQSGDRLRLISVPKTNEEFYEDDLIIILSIGGTEYEDVEVKVTDPTKTVGDQISSIVQVFELPEIDGGGNPVQYLLGRTHEDGEDEILELEDQDGREMSFVDYNIQSGDRLHLIAIPIAGYCSMISDAVVEKRPPAISIPKKNSLLMSLKRWLKGLFSKHKEINSTLFAPFMAERGETMTIQVLFYRDSQYGLIEKEAKMVDPDASERGTRSMGIPVEKGDALGVHLSFFTQHSEKDYVIIDDCVKQFYWNSSIENLVFSVYVDSCFSRSSLNGNVDILLNGVPVSAIAFNVRIVDDKGGSKDLAEIRPTQYDKVFISYSSVDAEKVQYISETCRAVNCNYFFDRHSLRPGDVFVEKIYQYIDNANLFILCWSQNAANSEWVERERKRALENWRQGKRSLRLYPIVIPPIAELPDDMKDIFNFGNMS